MAAVIDTTRRFLLSGAFAAAVLPTAAVPVKAQARAKAKTPIHILWDHRLKQMERIEQIHASLRQTPLKMTVYEQLKADEEKAKAGLRETDLTILNARPRDYADLGIIAFVVLHWERTGDDDVAHRLFAAINHLEAA